MFCKCQKVCMSQITDFFSAFDLPNNLAGDLSLFLLFVGISLAFGFIFGRWKLINILINVYIALAFIGVLPESLFLTAVYSKAIVFIVLVIMLTAIDERLF